MERAPFSIREFSVELRKEIVAEAEANKQSVGDFLEAVCVAARQAGWLRAAGQTKTLALSNRMTDGQLIEIAGNPDIPRWLRAAASRQLGALLGVAPPPPPVRRKALAAPENQPGAA